MHLSRYSEKFEQHRTIQLSTVLAKARLNALIDMQKSHQPNALVDA